MKQVIRFLSKNQWIAFLQFASLSIGIGAFLILVLYIYQELHYDIISEDSKQIYRVVRKNVSDYDPITHYPLAEKMEEDFDVIEKTTRVHHYYKTLACASENAKFNEKNTLFADEYFFDVFGFLLLKGDEATCLDNPSSVVISEDAAQKYFGTKDPIGRQIVIANRHSLTVSGVYPAFPANSNFKSDFVFPLELSAGLGVDVFPGSWIYPSEISTFIKLHKNADVSLFEKSLTGYLQRFVPDDNSTLTLQKLSDIHLNTDIFWEGKSVISRTYIYLVVCVALVILCVFFVNFLLIYLGSSPRRIYISSINAMFGAHRGRNILNTYGEIILLFTISFVIALGLVSLYQSQVNDVFPFLPSIQVFNYKILIFGFFVLLVLMALVSIYPVFFVSKTRNLISSSSPKNNVPGKQNLFQTLIFAQFALCIFLVLATSIIFKQTSFLQNFDTGIDKENLISIPLNQLLGDGIYNEKFDAFSEELKKYPGVENVTLAASSPELVNTSAEVANWEGRSEDQDVKVRWNSVFFDYFDIVGLDIVQGRGFSEEYPGDVFNGETSNHILNESAVKAMELKDPIGKWFTLYGKPGKIVGVVEDYNYASLHNPIYPMVYDINPFFFNTILLKINPANLSVVDDIEKVWNEFLPNYPLQAIFIKDQIDQIYSNEKKLGHYISFFAVIAIILNCFGLVGMSLLTINSKVKEIGIRKVNGAKTSSILAMFNSTFVRWFLLAFIVACPAGWFVLNNWLQNFAYKTSISWWVYVLSGLITMLIALITISIQSWNAAHKNPVDALRYE